MSDKKEIELLVCKCKDCTHWEIGREVLICKTCGLVLPAKMHRVDSTPLSYRQVRGSIQARRDISPQGHANLCGAKEQTRTARVHHATIFKCESASGR